MTLLYNIQYQKYNLLGQNQTNDIMNFLCIAANFSDVGKNVVTLNVTIDYVLLTKKNCDFLYTF